MRTTGHLHLGNLHGALLNWVSLQDDYECFCFLADWHALTTDYKEPGGIGNYLREMAVDYLAAGLDPERTTIFVQSRVKEHAELALLLSMITPLGWLERVPTYKEMKSELSHKDLGTFGFLGYPVLMAADILIYQARYVPVGDDQVPHLELCRQIARRFATLYGRLFPEPQPILTETPRLPGLDGRKMSKSYDNTIYLHDDDETVRRKFASCLTDPARARRTDPGDPEVCTAFSYHRLYTHGEELDQVVADCRQAGVGCFDCKAMLAENMLRELKEIRERRRELAGRPEEVAEILHEGTRRAREAAAETMDQAREKMGLGS